MGRGWWRAAVLAAAVVASPGVLAQANDVRIGFVDTERILREAAPAVRAQKRLEKDFAPRDQELQRLAARAKELQGSLEREAVTLAESERVKRERNSRASPSSSSACSGSSARTSTSAATRRWPSCSSG